MTGRNGSGKSVALLTALDIFLMAQLGLPVIATSVTLSPKKYFLLSFLERVPGDSTFRAKIAKDILIIRAINKMSSEERRRTIIIIDELGSATTPGDGILKICTSFIDWLVKQGVTVFMSTQIVQVSEHVRDHDGVNLIVSDDFTLCNGIGEGEPEKVAEEMGFFEALRISEE